jgi:hypothetical protein
VSFAHVGNLGTNSTKTTVGSDQEVTLVVTLAASVAVDQIVMVWLGADSTYNAGAPGDDKTIYERMRCNDSQNNLYSSLVGGTDGQSLIYAMGAIFITRVRNALSAGDTITCRLRAVTGGGVRCMSVEEFDCNPNLRWAACDPGPVVVTTRAADPAAISRADLESSREYMIVHFLACEGPNTDAYTWDADYTQITGAGTTGGAADTNIHIRGGFRIVSGITSDTVNVTSDTADRDYTQGMAVLSEVPVDLTFPRTPLRDDFNRANEDPLSKGGEWISTLCAAGPSGATPRFLRVLSNVAAGSVATTLGGSWFAEVFPGGQGEVWSTVAVAGGRTIIYNGSGCANTATVDGLAAGWTLFANGTNAGDYITLGSAGFTGGVDQMRLRLWLTMAAGRKFGIRRKGTDLHLWVDWDGSWIWVAALHGTGILAGFNSGGKLGLVHTQGATRTDDFGGGPIQITRNLLPFLHVGP